MTTPHKWHELIKRPLITEKTAVLSEDKTYAFEVNRTANKTVLKQAFEALFPGRTVRNIRTIAIPARQKRMGRNVGTISKSKKAIFTIDGDPIELFAGS